MAGGSLANILNKGSESLANSRVAVDVTGHNISNAHTPGYSRQIVNIETKTPIQYGSHIFGDGARIQSISRAHDGFLEKQIQKEVQSHNKSELLSKGLQKLEGLFNPDLTSTIRDRLVSFSNSLRDLSNYPEEPATRINVVENGKSLAQAFNSTYSGVLQVQKDSNDEMIQHMSVLNQKLDQIAELNAKIREMGAGGQSEVNDLEDKQDALIKDVGALININVYKDKNDQITIRGPNECLLVEGRFASHLSSEGTFTRDNLPRVVVSEFDKPLFTDITDKISRGKIGALIELRDVHSKHLRDTINNLAKGFGKQFNAVHETGFGLNSFSRLNGRSFFSGLNDLGGAAQNITVDDTIAGNPNAIATGMSQDTPGDNVVVNNLIKLFQEPYFEDSSITATGLYDKMIAKLGHETLQAKENTTASQIVFNKLKAQQEAFSGVSLDEEAANLLKYQHLFNASSKIITTANEMFQTVLDLKR